MRHALRTIRNYGQSCQCPYAEIRLPGDQIGVYIARYDEGVLFARHPHPNHLAPKPGHENTGKSGDHPPNTADRQKEIGAFVRTEFEALFNERAAISREIAALRDSNLQPADYSFATLPGS